MTVGYRLTLVVVALFVISRALILDFSYSRSHDTFLTANLLQKLFLFQECNEPFVLKGVHLSQYSFHGKPLPPFFLFLHSPVRDKYESSDLLHDRAWHPHILSAMLKCLHTFELDSGKPIRFLDVGGNLGFFSLMFASLPIATHVIVVEPSRYHYQLFEASLSLAPLEVQQRVHLFKHAVGRPEDKGRVVCFSREEGNQAATFVEAFESQSVASRCDDSAPLSTLDDIIREWMRLRSLTQSPVIHVMKIDIEGFEHFAFQGADMLLSEIRPFLIITEFVPWRMKKQGILDPVTTFLQFFFKKDYIICDIVSRVRLQTLLVAQQFFVQKGPAYFTDLQLLDTRRHGNDCLF